MPQAPFRPLQSANRFGRQLCVGRAKAASDLQRVFEAHYDGPLISTTVAFGNASRCSRHNPASPSHNTVAGVSAVTIATMSARLNASDAIVGLLRAKAKRTWLP